MTAPHSALAELSRAARQAHPFSVMLGDKRLTPRQRPAVIEATEEAGNVLFELTARLAADVVVSELADWTEAPLRFTLAQQGEWQASPSQALDLRARA